MKKKARSKKAVVKALKSKAKTAPKPKKKAVKKASMGSKKPVAKTSVVSAQYDHLKLEKKWQNTWQKSGIYKTPDNAGKKPKAYVLDMFPYPSGTGLHVGHPKGYIATDIYSRFKKMSGFNVLHPMGWDAFGLPAEEFAIKNKIHPSIAVKKNVKRYKEQLSILGFNYDWLREVNTTEPEFYKWTQWAFLQMHKKGLTYESHEPINWCPSCKTGLANEDLENGKCERCGSTIEKRPIRQWVIKITDYADRLLKDLDAADYVMPEIVDKVNPHRKGAPLVERYVAHAIVFDPKKNKYLIIRSKKHGWDTVVIGGIEKEDNGDAVKTAIREIREETGYIDVEYKRTLGGLTKASYYTKHKGENRVAYATAVYFELKSEKRVEIGADEDKDNEILWVSPEEFVPGKMVNSELSIWLERLKDPEKGWPKPLLNWPESIKEQQRNWIGRSEGVNLLCTIKDINMPIEMYDSIPQTFFAQTFAVIAADHPKLPEIVKGIKNEKEILAFAAQIVKKRNAAGLEYKDTMDGMFTGRMIDYPAGQREIPLWIASYAVSDYGTGIVSCSAHDERDFAFAKKYDIPLKTVLYPEHDPALKAKIKNLEVFYREQDGVLDAPAQFKGRKWYEVRNDIIEYLVSNGWATRKVNYKLRDWVFSRQRYWGEPIPLIHCPKCGVVPVPEKELPLKLPNVKSYEPTGTGESPLAGIDKWVNVKCPQCKTAAKRETNTMPQWAGSSWYYLRYMDPKNKKALVSKDKEKYWSPVDFYVGGAEHATRHLIYARFWHKFLFDIGAISSTEPFTKLKNVGLIAGPDGRKMSKRFGNVVNPDDVVKLYGADTLRVYEMFMGPFEDGIAWSTDNMIGSRRFIERVWRLRQKVVMQKGKKDSAFTEKREIISILHKTIKKVTEDIDNFSLNTAVSAMMILLNALEKEEKVSKETYTTLITLLAPFAPHICDELWASMGNKKSIHLATWPTFTAEYLVDDEVNMVVQINGKVRATIRTSAASAKDEDFITKTALGMPEIKNRVGDLSPDRVIFVPGKIINLVFKALNG